jgi:hypothetical protein
MTFIKLITVVVFFYKAFKNSSAIAIKLFTSVINNAVFVCLFVTAASLGVNT